MPHFGSTCLILRSSLIDLADTTPLVPPMMRRWLLVVFLCWSRNSFHGQPSQNKNAAGDVYVMSLLIYFPLVIIPMLMVVIEKKNDCAPALRDHGLVEMSGARWG